MFDDNDYYASNDWHSDADSSARGLAHGFWITSGLALLLLWIVR